MNERDCPDCGQNDRLHEEIEAALADSALEPDTRRQLAGEARRRAAPPVVPERTEAMPKRRETLLVVGLAAAILLIVGAGLMFMPGDGGVVSPGERPDEFDVVRTPGEEPLSPEAWGDPKPYQSDSEFATPEPAPPAKVPEALTKDPLPERAPAPIGVLAGQVRTSDGRRLPGVTVDLTFDPYRSGKQKLPEGEKRTRSAQTDSDGEFRFEDVPVGTWRLTAAADGLAPRDMTGLSLTDRAGIEGVAVVLLGEGKEVGTIEGTAMGSEGQPLAKALITLRGTVGGSFHTTRTDEEGKYRADRLLPGSYSVSCQEYGGTSAIDYFQRAKQTKFVNVTPGKVTQVDFTGSGTLTGVVLDAKGNPMAGAIVRIAPLNEKGKFRDGKFQPVEVRTDAEGRFTMANAGIGPQSVSVQSTEAGNSFNVRLADIELDGGDRELSLQLVESGIEGRVTLVATGEPPEAKAHIALYRIKPWTYAGSAVMDKEGRYRFRSVPPGKYRLYVDLRRHRRVETDIDLASGELRSGMDAALEKLRPGTIVFTVKDADGKPVEGLMFSYNSKGNTWSTLHMDRGEPGVYTNKQLETGNWTVNIWRKDLATKQVEVSVVSGETTKVDAVMRPRPVK